MHSIYFLQVYELLWPKAHSDTYESLLSMRDEIGPMGLVKSPEFPRSLALLSLSRNETKLVEEWLGLYLQNESNVKCEKTRYQDLTYVLWALANVGSAAGPKFAGTRKAIFECVHSHSKEILASSEVLQFPT